MIFLCYRVQKSLQCWLTILKHWPTGSNTYILVSIEKKFGDSKLNKMLDAHPELTTKLIIQDYKNWIKHNLLDTDTTFNLSWIHDPQAVEDFCNVHDLCYDINWIHNIAEDLSLYVKKT